VIAQARTSEGGKYAFKDLKPGSYRVSCLKETTRRQDIKDAPVEPGKTARVNLDLYLP
jgi:hypothetical protein